MRHYSSNRARRPIGTRNTTSVPRAGAFLREQLSRGQEKLCALACVLAQARMYALERKEWPVIALDDLASELDREHQRAVIEMAASARAQVLVTGTELPDALRTCGGPVRMFHVEHGTVTSLL